MTDRGRVPALDGVRGVAIALVVGEHTRLLPGGNLGVVVFFVLSGYLITSLLLGEHDRTGTVNLPAFYRRRAYRLLPAVTVAVLAVVAVTTVLHAGTWGERAALVVVVQLYVANLALLLAHPLFAPIGWAWTLALEEQFYLLWPGVFRRSRLSRERMAVVLLAGAAAVAVARGAWVVSGHSVQAAYYAPWFRCDALLIGCALAMVPARRLAKGLPVALGVLVFGVMVAVWDAPLTLVAVLPAVAVASAVLIAASPAWLALPPLRYLGRISYALYLWVGVVTWVVQQSTGRVPHGLRGLLTIPVELALAVASTHLLEEPVRRLGQRHREVVHSEGVSAGAARPHPVVRVGEAG